MTKGDSGDQQKSGDCVLANIRIQRKYYFFLSHPIQIQVSLILVYA
jgi:hypothetical protein